MTTVKTNLTFIPTTKGALIREIKRIAPQYTRDDIETIYDQVRYANPRRSAYYAKKAGVRRLQAFLHSLRNRNNGI